MLFWFMNPIPEEGDELSPNTKENLYCSFLQNSLDILIKIR